MLTLVYVHKRHKQPLLTVKLQETVTTLQLSKNNITPCDDSSYLPQTLYSPGDNFIIKALFYCLAVI